MITMPAWLKMAKTVDNQPYQRTAGAVETGLQHLCWELGVHGTSTSIWKGSYEGHAICLVEFKLINKRSVMVGFTPVGKGTSYMIGEFDGAGELRFGSAGSVKDMRGIVALVFQTAIGAAMKQALETIPEVAETAHGPTVKHAVAR